MKWKIVMDQFFRQSNQLLNLMAIALILLVQTVIFLISGCRDSAPTTFGRESDITEDLHHRMKAGLFEVGKDPVICRVYKKRNLHEKLRLPFHSNKAPHKMVRISWERGSFWVKSDDRALVVIYMDTEATFSHVQIATLEGGRVNKEFRESIEYPVR